MTRRPGIPVRDRILAAGEAVFARAGYDGATVDDVIGEAETSRATFYRYFSSKDDLFRDLSVACFREMRDVVRGFGELGTQEPGSEAERAKLQELVGIYRSLHSRYGGVIRAWTERSNPPDSPLRSQAAEVFDDLLGEMSRALTAAGAQSAVDVEVQSALFFLALERSSFYISNRHSRIDPERLPATLATMLQRAYFGAGSTGPARRLRIARG